MTPAQFAFHLTFWFFLKIGQASQQVSASVQQDTRFVSVKAGESVTLQCSRDPYVASRFYWYKLTLGQKPQLVSTVYKYDRNGTFHNEFKNNPRFMLETKRNQNNLKITNLRISDSATYYCLTGQSYKIEFDGGTIIHVKGSGLNIQALVHQSESETIQAGDSVNLNCTVQTGSCDGEHRVYWFKNSEEYYPGLIYTYGGSKGQGERKSGEQTNICVYNLPLMNLNVSHAGTYYCAVASCGHILFGNGTNLDVKAEENSVYLLMGALVFTLFLSILQAVLLFMLCKTNYIKDSESRSRISSPSTTNAEGDQNEEILHYAALTTRSLTDQNKIRSPRQRNENTDCVYSSMKM